MSRVPLSDLFWLRACRALLVALVVQVWCAAAEAQHTHRLWQTEEGLPHNVVQALAQTRDGFLWVGTREGLARFDGVRFTLVAMPGENRAPSITALAATAEGALWVGTQSSGVVRFTGGTVERFGSEEGLPHLHVRGFARGPDGAFWVLTAGGVARFADGRFVAIKKLAAAAYRNLCIDGQNNLWLAAGGFLQRQAGDRLHTFTGRNGLASDSARCAIPGPEGDVWIGFDGGVSRFHAGAFTHTRLGRGPAAMVSVLHQTREGELWVGTYDGVYRLVNDSFVREGDPETPGQVRAIFEDQEGTVWVGGDEGLRAFHRKCYTSYARGEGLAYDRSVSVCEAPDGAFWLGTWGGGLNRFRDGVFTTFTPANGLGANFVYSVLAARGGDMWIGFDYNGGLDRLDGQGRFTHFGREQGFAAATVTALQDDEAGSVWIGTRNGLYAFRDGKFTRFDVRDGLGHPQVNALAPRRAGGLWIGTQKGVAQWDGARLSPLATAEVGLDDAVSALHEDAAGTLWLATRGRGLKWVTRGRVTSCGAKDGLGSDSIHALLEDDDANLWLSTSRGILTVSKAELGEFASRARPLVSAVLYGREKGIPSADQSAGGPQPAAWKGRDGRLWFRALRGVVVLDPSRVDRNPLPPSVLLEEVVADRRQVMAWAGPGAAGNSASPLVLPPGHGDLEFRFTALSLQAAERNQFKYRLEGADTDWVEAGTLREAHYHRLPPGRYRFAVIASNDDGVWNETGASLAVVLEPHLWQTRWFAFAGAAAVMLVVGGTVRHLTRRKMLLSLQELERKNAIEVERTRIAQDIHDDLGAKLTEISMLAAVRPTSDGTYLAQRLNRIAQTSRQAVESMDAIVWTIDPGNDSLAGLADYLASFAEEYLGTAGLQCRLEIPPLLPEQAVSTDIRHHLFLAVKEALHNAVRHAAASEVTVRLGFTDGLLAILVRDNGRGFAPDAVKRGNGLRNLQHRLAQIGGQCALGSAPGGGTQVEFTLRLAPPSASP